MIKEELRVDDEDDEYGRGQQQHQDGNSWEMLDHPLRQVGLDQLEVSQPFPTYPEPISRILMARLRRW